MDQPATLPGDPERWLPVAAWESFYEVSNWGRVWSRPRKNVRGQHNGRILKMHPNKGGYLRVVLQGGGKRQAFSVHILVARAFLGPCPVGQQVRHGPGGLLDNRPVNLCYGTGNENMQDKLRDDTMPFGTRHPNAKLTEEIVRECRARMTNGESGEALALEFGISGAAVYFAVSGITWRHVA